MSTQIDILREQLREAPESIVVWEELGDLYAQKRDCESAVEAYNFVLALKPDSKKVYRKKILVLLSDDNESNIREGISELEIYCQDNPHDREMYTLRLLFLLGNELDFMSAHELIQENDPNYSLEKLEQNLQAEDALQAEYMNIVNSYILLKQYRHAVRLLDMLIQRHSDDFLLYLAYGTVFLYTSRLDDAKRMFEKAYYYVNSVEDKDTYCVQTGLAFFNVKDYKMAYFYLGKIRLDENKEDVIPYMACCCLENGDEEKYLYYIAQLDKAPFFCVRNAFKNHVPKNMTPRELISFLKELYQRYNS